VCDSAADVMGVAHKCDIVERFVGLVESVGVALVLGIGCFALGTAGVVLYRCLAVENYIWGLLLLCIVQSPRFTNSQYGIGGNI
jgi:hypothetical protein